MNNPEQYSREDLERFQKFYQRKVEEAQFLGPWAKKIWAQSLADIEAKLASLKAK